MENASLDEFLGDSDDTGESNSGPPTSRWSPDGTACADCAETATRLWQQESRLVCASCKNWE